MDTIRQSLLTHNAYCPQDIGPGIPQFTRFVPITPADTRKIIFSLAPKSCEFDPLPARLFRDCVQYLLEFITTIINKSLTSGEFILSWKTSILRPLIKGSNLPTTYKRYRPDSNVPFLSKVLEKAALSQFQTHCDDHDLIPGYQSAYHRNF